MDFGDFDPSSMFGGRGGGGFNFGGASDVKLQYIDDDPDSYSNIFSSAKTNVSDADQARLITSLKALSSYENLEDVLDMDAVLRYFIVHSFVVNGDTEAIIKSMVKGSSDQPLTPQITFEQLVGAYSTLPGATPELGRQFSGLIENFIKDYIDIAQKQGLTNEKPDE